MTVSRVLISLVWLIVLSAGGLSPDALAQSGPGDQPATLSLDELTALMEEDEVQDSITSMTPDELLDIAGLVLVLGIALVSFVTQQVWLKYGVFVLVIGYFGFAKSSLVSIVNIFAILEGNLPTFRHGVPWYLLIGFTVVSTILWGRLYCGRLCAFGALTQLMDRIVPARWRIEPPAWFDRRAIYLKYVILVAVLAYYFTSGDFLIYRYVEPFWMFTLNGSTVMWTLLTLLLLATVFVRNLYCRYFCSVGAALGVLSQLTVFRIKRWRECNTCTICEHACEWGAIDGPRISVAECVRCDDCERIYDDQEKCVHWIVLKKSVSRVQPAP